MLRSMYTSISGLKNHQTLLDTVANNIANVNTYGFKSSRVSFKDMLTQTMQGASAPTATLGGTNPRQIGLGMQVDSISQVHTQGNIQATGTVTDVAIQGDGFFVITADKTNIASGTEPKTYTRAGNFLFDQAGDMVTTDGYYVVGIAEQLPAGSGIPDGANLAAHIRLNVPPTNSKGVTIGQDGKVSYIDATTGQVTLVGWIAMAKFANPAGLQVLGANKWAASSNSGDPNGSAVTVLATAGDSSGVGTVVPGALEMSNVDLATEFTEMIRAQRGFQANSRIITTSDEILQELVNLKR